MSGIMTGLTMLANLGLPHVLLWLLSFAISYELLEKAKFGSTAAVKGLIAIVISLLVVVAAPAAVITAITSMSTSLIVIAIAGLVLGSIYVVLPNVEMGKTIKTIMSVVAVLVAVYIFSAAGGFAIIGATGVVLPFVSNATIVSLAMIAIVYWIVSQEPKAATPTQPAG